MAGCSDLSQSHSCVWAQLQVGETDLLILAGLCHVAGPQLEQQDSGLPNLSFCSDQPGLIQVVMSGFQKNEQKHGWPLEACAWNWPIIPPLFSSGSS